MSEEIPATPAVQESPPTSAIVPVGQGDLEISASTPQEMLRGHFAMIDWCKQKIAAVQTEAKELREAYEHAKKNKWKNDVLKRHSALALKRVVFYQKFLAALEAGYSVVPNFPVELFAIRTSKPKPSRMWARLRWEGQKNFQQDAQRLPAGQGDYQNPQPVISKSWRSLISDPTGKTQDTWSFYASEWKDMEFPANMARVYVMESATRAMDEKVFDEIGFAPTDKKRNPDPILIGRIIDPRPVGYGELNRVSFMIAWHVDTRTL